MRKFLTATLALVFVLGLCGLALATNTATVTQDPSSWNRAYIKQIGATNLIWTDQIAAAPGFYNYTKIDQVGVDNKLVDADYCGVINLTEPAHQVSTNSYNDLRVSTNGNHNRIGLDQRGKYYNLANITQTGNNNSVGIWQRNSSGFNQVTVTQTGDPTGNIGTICQDARGYPGEDNVATLNQ